MALFLAQGVAVSALSAWLVVALLGRYEFAIDPQMRKCLPNANLMVVDRAVRNLARGQVIAFNTDLSREPLMAPHSIAAKIIIGVPGDHIKVSPVETTVNGVVVGLGLADAKKAHLDVKQLTRELVIPPGFYWLMGESGDSYDSRYWGPVPAGDFVGDVHVLF
jgi:conjugal transfer pilin signal peptidase TrbI